MNNPIAYEPGVRIASAISARELKTTLKEGDSVVKTFSTLDEVVGFCIFIKGSGQSYSKWMTSPRVLLSGARVIKECNHG